MLAGAQTVVPFTSDRWHLPELKQPADSQAYVLETYLGKPAIRLLRTNGQLTRALLKDADFTNGIIEYDAAFPPDRGGVGMYFRMQDSANYEWFYIRPHQSGNPDATQYIPIFQGSDCWQLYHGPGYSAPVRFAFNEWVHFKFVISGSQMEVFVGDMEKPALFVPKLKRTVQPGMLALMGKARFANFSYTPVANPPIKSVAPAPAPVPAGIIKEWQVANTFPEKKLEKVLRLTPAQKTGLTWQKMSAEETGILNLATGPAMTEENNTTFARLVIESDRAQVKTLQLGFSDRARVFLNDQVLYSGRDEFQSRDYRFLGTVGLFDEVYLPLKKGRNELWVAVSETFGGWGIKAALADRTGINVH
jgi:hypothetical protein